MEQMRQGRTPHLWSQGDEVLKKTGRLEKKLLALVFL